jgi:hypothetical protein
MTHGGKTCWKALRVRGPTGAGRSDRHELHGSERLVALYRFQNGEGADHAFGCSIGGDGRREVVVTDPGQVDWDSFPLVAALEAVTHDELSRLRSLLRSPSSHDVDAGGSAPQTRVPDGSWGLGIGGSAPSEV